jgi:DNA-binding transcriptional regulator YbjK
MSYGVAHSAPPNDSPAATPDGPAARRDLVVQIGDKVVHRRGVIAQAHRVTGTLFESGIWR